MDESRVPPGVTRVDEHAMVGAADRLGALLEAHGIVVHHRSWPARVIAAAREVPAWASRHDCRQRGVPCTHLAESLRRTRLVADLLVLVDLVEEAGRVLPPSRFSERLALLGAAEQSATTRARQQNERELVFELMCVGWMNRIATDVDLVEPPDVTCTYRGASWGLACKCAYGTSKAAADAIRKGAKQLEKSQCQSGAVVVRITDVFPHEDLMRVDQGDVRTVPSFPSGKQAFVSAMGLARPFVTDTLRAFRGDAAVRARFPKLAVVAFVGHSIANLHTSRGAVSTIVPVPHFLSMTNPAHPFVNDLISALRV